MPFDRDMFSGGLGQFFGGLFGHSDRPYKNAMDEYNKWMQKGEGAWNPFLQAGQGAIGDYQNWLKGMQNPGDFVNNLMGQYQESPYTHYLQQQSQRAGTNMGSASGLSGSSALAQQMQQNAGNIAQQGLDSWLKDALGINQMYGQGQGNLMQGGQNAANALGGMYQNAGNFMGAGAYNQQAGRQNDFGNMMNGGFGILGGLGFL
jgi:hypothetical protein